MSTEWPTPREASLAGLLHDIGKLAQRAHADEQALRAAYRGQDFAGLQAAILPSAQGRHTHRHALWTDFFFELAEQTRLAWPAGVDLARVRKMAIRHHNPADPEDWIIAEADRLASGLERKARDEAEESGSGSRPGAFREVELRALIPSLDIGVAPASRSPLWHPAGELSATGLMPKAATPAEQPRRFASLWQAWLEGWSGFASDRSLSGERFEQAALGLSERLLWSLPSSTVDQPDVSLHDHAQAVAAIAAALAAFHAAAGELGERAVRDRSVPKFRLIALDLSGIQAALFRLAGSVGVARVLRARSFLMAELVSAAALALRDRLGLPASSVLIAAGGKAELLAPALADLDLRLEQARETLDRWMVAHWQGDLALNLAAGSPFAATAFAERGAGFPAVRAELASRLDLAKHRPFHGWRSSEGGFIGTGVIAAPFGADGACGSCGARPAVVTTPRDGVARCSVCDGAARLGQRLPKAEGFALVDDASTSERDPSVTAERVALPFGLALLASPRRDGAARRTVLFEGHGEAAGALSRPKPHVALLDDPEAPVYRWVGLHQAGEGEEPPERGDLMSFAHLGAEALETAPRREFRGRALLGIVKADVDRLGQVFGRGLGQDRSPARIAQLSRLIDGYFSRRLAWLLRTEFPASYTVYAGGDDLLLVLPWRMALPFAARLRSDFRDFSGGNANLSLSAGIAFVHPHHPIGLAVGDAEEMLDRAKDAGRDRVALFDRALSWPQAEATLDLSEALDRAVADETLPPTFLYRMRSFAAMRRRIATSAQQPSDLGWAAKWGYHRARFLDRAPKERRDALAALFDRALPPPAAAAEADPEIAMTIALWRNR